MPNMVIFSGAAADLPKLRINRRNADLLGNEEFASFEI